MIARRVPVAALAAATALALSATPALAKGGSGGGGTGGGGGGGGGTVTQPAPTFDPWTLCPDYRDPVSIALPDGSTTFANVVADMACLVVRVQPSGVLSIYQLGVAPGWNYTIKSGGGGNSNQVDVEFSNPTTGGKHSILVKPGKTDIR
jgi:hypothetical protein